MYNKRIKIFVITTVCCLAVCLLRLIQIQIFDRNIYQAKVEQLKAQGGRTFTIGTMRGRILDRYGNVLATDEAKFNLCINYRLASVLDERARKAQLLADKTKKAEIKQRKRIEQIGEVLRKCEKFGVKRSVLEDKLQYVNDRMWTKRTFQAWRQNCLLSAVLETYRKNDFKGPMPDFNADFEKYFPDANERLRLIGGTDLIEMRDFIPLFELDSDNDIFSAQVEFAEADDVKIQPELLRIYRYNSTASQIIGWVGPAQQEDKTFFADDKFLKYLDKEVCGKDGVEYVCEAILRGKRGEIIYDTNGSTLKTDNQLGKDVQLTLDIELQKKIEDYIVNYDREPNRGPGIAAVLIDVPTGDIMAMASMPDYDLNRARYDYDKISSDRGRPMLNRVICSHYPPGSVVKPLILITALETGKINANDVISCKAERAPNGWPNCWIYNKSHVGHDDLWANSAVNALKGSCNVYFSHLANRLEPADLQRSLYNFGYGRRSYLAPASAQNGDQARELRQVPGIISSTAGRSLSEDKGNGGVAGLPTLKTEDLRWFGIGQGSLRVTPLQVANSMATIARGGIYKNPRLFTGETTVTNRINISNSTMNVVRKGMWAVVNDSQGTAYNEFSKADFGYSAVTVYGKTGSTERPEHAWFAGFAEDNHGRSVALAVIVEGGQHGATDAGPIARKMIQLCIEVGYIGKK